jgi:hypothetical protein
LDARPLYMFLKKRKKLVDKGKKCIFIDYNKISKTYKLFDLVDKKILLVGMFVMNLQM